MWYTILPQVNANASIAMPDAAVDASSVLPDAEFRAVLGRGLPVRKQCNVTYFTMVKNK